MNSYRTIENRNRLADYLIRKGRRNFGQSTPLKIVDANSKEKVK